MAAPMTPDIPCDLGLALKTSGRHEAAIAAQARATELLPQSALAWSNHGTALAAAKRFDDAIASFTKALSLDPDTAELVYNLGNAKLASGDPGGAEATFVRALELSPHHAGALENLGCSLKEQGRLAEAEELFAVPARFTRTIWISAGTARSPCSCHKTIRRAGRPMRHGAPYQVQPSSRRACRPGTGATWPEDAC